MSGSFTDPSCGGLYTCDPFGELAFDLERKQSRLYDYMRDTAVAPDLTPIDSEKVVPSLGRDEKGRFVRGCESPNKGKKLFMNGPNKKSWSEEEINALEIHYHSQEKEVVMKHIPDRTWSSIGRMASKLGIGRDKSFSNPLGREAWNKGKTWEEIYGKEESERIRKMHSNRLMGRTPWNKDKKGVMPVPWNKGKNIRLNSGKTHFKKGQVGWWKGKKLPFTIWNKGIEHPNVKGDKNPRWVGGRLPYYGPRWFHLKNKARIRDRHRCQNCHTFGLNGKICNVHHIIPYRVSKSNELKNLITLCSKCHTPQDAIYIKIEKLYEELGEYY